MDINKYLYKPCEDTYSTLFQIEESNLRRFIDKSVSIEHFGSTAVPNLGGKGIIDIYITADDYKLKDISSILQKKLGYDFRPNGGDSSRLFFRRYEKDAMATGKITTYHLHLSDNQNRNYISCIALRDYLRAHPKEVSKYDEIKMNASENAMKSLDYEEQKQIYQKLKADLVVELTEKALKWKEQKSQL